MRMLFSTLPGLGHFFPIVPLAWGARAAGHDVLIATTSEALEASGRAGLPAVDVAPGLNVPQVFQRMQERTGRSFLFTRDALSDAIVQAISGAFAEISDRMADRTVAVVRSWQPDMVVHTPIGGAGPLAATMRSIPAVLHGFGLGPAGRVTQLVNLVFQGMKPTFERHGLPGEVAPPLAVIDPTPPSMGGPDRLPAWPVRYVPYNEGGALPDWLRRPAVRTRICMTLGTVVPYAAGVGALPGVIEAVRDLDAEVVLALGQVDCSDLGSLPGNVHVAGWVPLSALLPTCRVLVHHGGAGTTMNALAAGVPQLVLAHGADQHANAAAVEQRGVGLSHLPEEADPATMGSSLHRLLEEPAFSEAAGEVRQEIADLSSPAEMVHRLEETLAQATEVRRESRGMHG
ncbi:MAG: nucleotide disphospho-sugar-binding domain-containing protein [Candidatus Dormibacteria bacterium]